MTAAHAHKDVELAYLENGTSSTVVSLDFDDPIVEGAIGEPDLDHEEIEQMDEGHQDDLKRIHVGYSITYLFLLWLLTAIVNCISQRSAKIGRPSSSNQLNISDPDKCVLKEQERTHRKDRLTYLRLGQRHCRMGIPR
jgi:hypothetical protein